MDRVRPCPIFERSAKHKPILRSGERRLIFFVHSYFQQEFEKGAKFRRDAFVAKTACATNTSVALVRRIVASAPDFATPNKQRPTRPKRFHKVDDFDRKALRRLVHSFYRKSIMPTLKQIHSKAVEDLQFPYGITHLKNLLLAIGFVYQKRKSNVKAVFERNDIIAKRHSFLRKMKKARSESRPLIFLDETWLNQGYTKAYMWSDSVALKNPNQAKREGLTIGCVDKPAGEGRRIMICHAGSDQGFIPNALRAFRGAQNDGDYHKNMDATNFEDWFVKQLIPNIPSHSAIIMDNASYHSRRVESYPLSTWRKAQLQEWLSKYNIPWSKDMLRAELWDKAKKAREKYQDYVVDKKAAEAGHEVIRLPPYHSDLNPIELIWAQMKGFVARNNTTYTLDAVSRLLQESVTKITPPNWKNACDHCYKLEQDYWESDCVMDIIIDPVVIQDSSGDSESDTALSEVESEEDQIMDFTGAVSE